MADVLPSLSLEPLMIGHTHAEQISVVEMPRFTDTISPGYASYQRWRHNVVSWATIPLRTTFGRKVPSGTFGILMYHRVCPNPRDRFTPTYSVTPERFGKQLDWLLKHDYKAWPLDRLLQARAAGETVDDRIFAVTFDDGYENNYLYALPILEELRVPATVFIATAFLDSNQPYPFDNWIDNPDPIIPSDTWKPMTMDQCRRLSESKYVTLGSHTHTHADFRDNAELIEKDIRLCNAILSHEFGIDSPAFAYPFGVPEMGFTTHSLGDAAKRAGCSCALEIGNSCVLPDVDIYHWPRFDIASGDTGPSIAGKLDGWSTWIRRTLSVSHKDSIAVLPEKKKETQRATTPIESPSRFSSLVEKTLQLASNRGGLALFDQGIVSGTNFMTSLVVGRHLGKESLGVLFITMSVFTVLQCVTDQLVHTPYLVRSPRLSKEQGKRFVGSVFVHTALITLLAIVMIAIAALVLLGGATHGSESDDLPIMLGLLAVLLPGMMLREFLHNLLHNQLRQSQVVLLDASVSILLLGSLLAMSAMGTLTVKHALIAIGLSAAVVAVGWSRRLSGMMTISPKTISKDFWGNWTIGRWTLGSYLVGSSAPTILPWLLTGTHGVEATGLLAACLTLVGVAQTFLRGLGKYMAPQMSVAYASGGRLELRKSIQTFLIFALLITTLIGTVLSLGGQTLVQFAYGSDYDGASQIMMWLGFGCILQTIDIVMGNGLLAITRSDRNFASDCARFAATAGLAFLLVPSLGPLGVAMSLVLGMVAGLMFRMPFLIVAISKLPDGIPVVDQDEMMDDLVIAQEL